MDQTGVLEVKDLTKEFPSKSGGHLRVLEDINLRVASGEFLSIVGRSGCGKSTLLRLIVGLDGDFQGELQLDGRPITGPGLERGIVFQDHRLFPWLTVQQNIGLGLINASISTARKAQTISEHIRLVGLEGFETSYPHQISGGMSQRVAIARALVSRPRVLLLDEPFGALDAFTRQNLQEALLRIWRAEGITMVLVTHDVEEAVYLGDRVVVMDHHPGRISSIVPVLLSHQRDRLDPSFARIKARVLAHLSEDDRSKQILGSAAFAELDPLGQIPVS